MTTRKIQTWRDSEGVGATPAPDYVVVDQFAMGGSEAGKVNDSTMPVSYTWITMTSGTTGVTNVLETITGGIEGTFIHIRSQSNILVKDGVDNLRLAGDFQMDFGSTICTLTLIYDGTNWLEISRAVDTN